MSKINNAPERPTFLTREAKREWDRIIPELERSGRLETTDLALLATYCVTFARWIESEKMVKKHGAVAITPNGYEQKSAWLTISDKAQDQLVRQIAALGYRRSVGTVVATAAPEDDAADFFAVRR